MKGLKNIIMFVLCIVLVISFAACHGDGGGSPAQTRETSGIALTGNWGTNALSSDPVETMWERGSLTVNADNSTFQSTLKSNGTSTSSTGTITMHENGMVTLADPGGAIDLYPDLGGTVMHGVNVNDGSEEIFTALKKADSYETGDVQGIWKANILLSSPGLSGWERGAVNIDSAGNVTATFDVEKNGVAEKVTSGGSITVSNDGLVTATATLSAMPGLEGVMDAHKTVMIWTGTLPEENAAELAILTKQAESYSEGDLVGAWKFSTLSAGSTPSAAQGTVTVSSGGSALIVETGVQRKLSISADGTVTIEGFPYTEGAMDSGKTVIVFTETLTLDVPGGSNSTGSDIIIFTKQ